MGDRLSWGAILRGAGLLLMVTALALSLASCGKKGKLTPPDGAVYPRDYPTR